MSDGQYPRWVFEPVGPMGGATGNAFVNTLQAAGMSPEAELAREAIQNSCDAAEPQRQRVRVVFRIVTLEGENKRNFLDCLSLQQGIGKRLDAVRLAPDNCLKASDQPLRLLYIEDYNTVGLYGNPHNRQSNFHRLLLSVGDAAKALSSVASGGSYGYGKSALSMNSRLRTIVVYSAFERDETGATARLMACAYFDAHEFGGKEWTGRAWFGLQQNSKELIVDPLRDEQAHRVAALLGFKPRYSGQHGTSILIIDSHAHDHRRLIEGIEDWWWPRLVDEELDVVVETDREKYFPQPKRRDDLLPFIECYWLAIERTEPTGPHQKSDRFNKLHGYPLGSYGLQLLDHDRAEQIPENRIGCVALIRSPKMVVTYAPLGKAAPPAVGVFVADEKIDEILKLSEPPNHDRWDYQSGRLELAKAGEEIARNIVRQIQKRLKIQMHKFQAHTSPPKSKEERRLEFLERKLGALFHPLKSGRAAKEGETAPVEIRFREGPNTTVCNDRQLLETFATIAIRLRDDSEENTMDAIVRVCIPLLEDEHGKEGDLLPITIESNDDLPIESAKGKAPELHVKLSKYKWLNLSVRSEPYDPRWSTKVDVEVVPQLGKNR